MPGNMLGGLDKNPAQPIRERTKAGDKGPSYIVGIGASAGGLEALQLFFNNMPVDSGLGFVVVQHLSPDYKSLMVELLSKHTSMEVLRVENGIVIRPNCVYLIPPKKDMEILDGMLFLSEQQKRHSLNLPIDTFFLSLAEDQRERAIGIILSGTGSDGTRGVTAIKGEGGTVLVQDAESAQFDGMPKSAIATGLADFIMPPAEMPGQIMKFISHPYLADKKEPEEVLTKEEDSFSKLIRLLQKRVNVDFTYYKPATVVRRIERRMGIVQVHSLDDYTSYLLNHPKEINALFKDLLIGVTKFFRDSQSFKVLRDTVIPVIFENLKKKRKEDEVVRVWVAGCCTGEEPYSIAMLFLDYMERNNVSCEVKVFATDLDRSAIEFAGIGLYPDSIVADIEPEFINKYFEKKATGYQVRRSIREMVVFALQNLIKDPPFTKVDLISCRNLLIYLQPVMQQKVLSLFNYALTPDGYLFLGSSETLGDMIDAFEHLDLKNRIYRHRGVGTLPLKDVLLPSVGREMLSFANQHQMGQHHMMISQSKYNVREKYFHEIIRRIAPTTLVINEQRELVQAFGNTRAYLQIPEGNVNLDILAMLPRELSLALSSAIHKVRKDRQPVNYSSIRIKDGNVSRMIAAKVDYVQTDERQAPFFLIVIQEETAKEATELNQVLASGDANPILEQRINDLEQEVQFTLENLQATIEELQTSNEELQATNEELLAANEELQSTNEELQSVNEELNTVNAEYQSKNIELTELNNDIRNLMESTDIGTIFLDRQLCIRKFTPAVTRVINLLEQDIGRPFSDLAIPFAEDLLPQITAIRQDTRLVEKVAGHGSQYFLLRFLPFINDREEFDGVVITLINITEQKNAESALQSQYDLLRRIMENSPSVIVRVDLAGKISFVNRQAEEAFGYKTSSLLRMSLDSPELKFSDLDGGPVAGKDGLLAMLVKTRQPVNNYIIRMERKIRKKVNELVFKVTANPTFNERKEIDGAVLQFDTVAHQTL